eukprot:scaffold1.g5223.t1
MRVAGAGMRQVRPAGRQTIRPRTVVTAAPTARPPAPYAVIGGGFAGLATAWHLLRHASPERPMQLHLYDAYGLAAGGSGVAAGLLHPYTPRGKLLWRGLEAFQDALALVEAAEAAAAAEEAAGGASLEQFTWRHGILRQVVGCRPARSIKQARDLARHVPADAAAMTAAGAALVDGARLAELVPGLRPEMLLPEPAELEAPTAGGKGGGTQRQLKQQQQPTAAGLMAGRAVTLNPARYLQALWAGCQQAAAAAGASSVAELRRARVESLAQLQREQGPYVAVVVAAGAAVGTIAEAGGLLPLELCQGYTLHMQPPGDSTDSSSSNSSSSSSGSSSVNGTIGTGGAGGSSAPGGYPPGAPSLLGSPYISAHGSRSLVVGATKRYGLTPAEALAQCAQPAVGAPAERAAAEAALLPPAAQLWPPLGAWRVEAVLSGVRALPTRGSDGSIPYLGRLPAATTAQDAAEGLPRANAAGDQEEGRRPAWWIVGGLGSRGLVYHAWLGRLAAEAALAGSEAGLPPELLRWKATAG